MSAGEFLKGLPSYNENNFSRYQPDSSGKNKGPSVYISTKDHPSCQVITTEKTSILFKYLQNQVKKSVVTKRESRELEETSETPRKRIRSQNANMSRNAN